MPGKKKELEFQMMVSDVAPKTDKKNVPSHKIIKLYEKGTSSTSQFRVDPKDSFFKDFHEYAVSMTIEDLGFVKPKTPEKEELKEAANHPDQRSLDGEVN